MNLPVRRERDSRRFSMSSIRSPVSMALELATALRMLAWETDTLPVLFLRTMGRLQNKMIARIIALGRPVVLSAFRHVSQSKVDTNNALLTGPELLPSKPDLQSSNPDKEAHISGETSTSRKSAGMELCVCRHFDPMPSHATSQAIASR